MTCVSTRGSFGHLHINFFVLQSHYTTLVYCRFILFFDIGLLICRDADLWADVTTYLSRKLGWFGTLGVTVIQLLSGHSDTLAETIADTSEQAQQRSREARSHSETDESATPSEEDKRRQRRYKTC